MNVIFHEGLLGKDVEVKRIQNGEMFVLLISDNDESGGIDWIKHISFTPFPAEILKELKKGVKVRVKSRLKHLRWIDPKSNRQRTRLTCIVEDIFLCEK